MFNIIPYFILIEDYFLIKIWAGIDLIVGLGYNNYN